MRDHRESSAENDECKYWEYLSRGMMARANAGGRKDVADEIHTVFAAREKQGP